MTPRDLSCAPLEPSQIAQVFPLVREIIPGLDLADWRRQAAAALAPAVRASHGIIAVRNAVGYFCGLAIYHVEPAADGARLVADHFVAFDILDRTRVSGVLLAGLVESARRLGCVAVETSLVKPRDRLVERFRAAGHDPKLMLMSKQLGKG